MEHELRALPRRHTPEGHVWSVDSILGEGGNGRAYLWNLVRRRDQAVVDRVVLKYSSIYAGNYITKQGPGYGDLGEVFIARSMISNDDSPEDIFTVPILAAEHCSWAMDAWRFYSPYYSFGDLRSLIRAQGKDDSADHTKGFRQLPEPFLWYLLHRLSAAAVIMQRTFATEDRDYQVVHCDLKPANLFLGAPGSLGKNVSFPIYPPVYVSDFGNSKITYTGDPFHHKMIGMCTEGWAAPEITPFTTNNVPKEWQAAANSQTNVWQIGYTLLSVMQGKTSHETDIDWDTVKDTEFAPSYKPLPKRTPALEAENPLRVNYSDHLLEVLHACVMFDPSKRPTAEKLHAHVSDCILDHTDGVEDWGTSDWFEDKIEQVDPDSDEDEIDEHGNLIPREEPFKGTVSELVNKFKSMLRLPGAVKRSGRVGRTGRTPIIREESPMTRMSRRRRDHNRRRQIVARQIKVGLEPKLNRYVSTEPTDDVFNLDDKYKLIHPKGNHLLNDYWNEPGPAKTSFTPYIDDIRKYFGMKRAFERTHPHDLVPVTGRGTHDFRLAGEEKGEARSAYEDFQESFKAIKARREGGRA